MEGRSTIVNTSFTLGCSQHTEFDKIRWKHRKKKNPGYKFLINFLCLPFFPPVSSPMSALSFVSRIGPILTHYFPFHGFSCLSLKRLKKCLLLLPALSRVPLSKPAPKGLSTLSVCSQLPCTLAVRHILMKCNSSLAESGHRNEGAGQWGRSLVGFLVNKVGLCNSDGSMSEWSLLTSGGWNTDQLLWTGSLIGKNPRLWGGK